MFYSTGANPKGGDNDNSGERDKENEGGINYSLQKVTIRRCNIDLLNLFPNVCPSQTILHISIYL